MWLCFFVSSFWKRDFSFLFFSFFCCEFQRRVRWVWYMINVFFSICSIVFSFEFPEERDFSCLFTFLLQISTKRPKRLYSNVTAVNIICSEWILENALEDGEKGMKMNERQMTCWDIQMVRSYLWIILADKEEDLQYLLEWVQAVGQLGWKMNIKKMKR